MMKYLCHVPAVMIEPLVRAALLEDLGRAGVLTTDAIAPREQRATTVLAARQPGVVAGLDLATLAFKLIDQDVAISVQRPDGSVVAAGDVVATVSGPARAILTGERTALNFLSRLSGIATATRAIVDAVAGHKAKIVCTRKTTPGLRVIEKYAVRAGGGSNHRFGLDDAVLIKDNHIAVARGIRPAIERVRGSVGQPRRSQSADCHWRERSRKNNGRPANARQTRASKRLRAKCVWLPDRDDHSPALFEPRRAWPRGIKVSRLSHHAQARRRPRDLATLQ